MTPPRLNRSVALVGYRGSGKTTVGRLLAARCQARFIDTDELIVARTGAAIRDIFESQGQAAFRQLEREAIGTITAHPPAVICVGGGAVEDPANVAILRKLAAVIWLSAPPEVLYERISADPGSACGRPPLTDADGLEEVRSVLMRRTPLYQAAVDHTVPTEGRTPHAVCEQIERWLGQEATGIWK